MSTYPGKWPEDAPFAQDAHPLFLALIAVSVGKDFCDLHAWSVKLKQYSSVPKIPSLGTVGSSPMQYMSYFTGKKSRLLSA